MSSIVHSCYCGCWCRSGRQIPGDEPSGCALYGDVTVRDPGSDGPRSGAGAAPL
jgi:hypothetical protein